jgi:hypothetical protein
MWWCVPEFVQELYSGELLISDSEQSGSVASSVSVASQNENK